MAAGWYLGAAGVCIPVKLLLAGKSTLNDVQRGSKDNSLKGEHTGFVEMT